MNLVVVIHSLDSGGAERVTTHLVNHWAKKGWQLTVITLASREKDFYSLHPSVQRIDLNLARDSSNHLTAVLNNLRCVVALRKLLLDIHPDIAVGMMTSSGVLLVLAALFIPKVATIASERTYPPKMPLGRMWQFMRGWTYKRATRVLMLTSEGLNWLKTEIPDARGVIIPNPIPYPLQSYEPTILPGSILTPARKLLLAVGRLDRGKGFDLLLIAFTKLAQLYQNWDLVILGEGSLRQMLEMQIQAQGLQGRCFLPGRAGNVSEWYVRADLYVMSSRFEGFPNTLGEAMAHGCAVVSFDCDTGPRDIIRHCVDGLLVPNGDVAELESALSCLMNDDALRHHLARKAIEVRERFAIEKISAKWEDSLSACL